MNAATLPKIQGETRMTKFKLLIAASLFLLAGLAVSASAQDAMMKDHMMKPDDKRPVVAIIRADWCPYCKELEPKMTKLMEEYGEKLKFVILDITDAATTKNAQVTAKSAGLDDFFERNKSKPSTVAIFRDKKQIFSTVHNTKTEDFIEAFNMATVK